MFNVPHVENEVSVRLLVLGAVQAVPVGAPQKGPAVAAQLLEQLAFSTQAAYHNVGDPFK